MAGCSLPKTAKVAPAQANEFNFDQAENALLKSQNEHLKKRVKELSQENMQLKVDLETKGKTIVQMSTQVIEKKPTKEEQELADLEKELEELENE